MSGHQTAPKADEYRSPYLRQAVAAGQPDPISRWVRYFQQRTAAEAAQSIAALATLAGGKPAVCVDGLLDDIDGSLATTAGDSSLDERLADVCQTATSDFARAIGRDPPPVRQADHGYMVPEPDILDVQTANKAPAGLLVINPLSFSRRVHVDASALDSLPAVAGAVLRAAEESGRKSIVVEVPPLGFACVVPGNGQTSAEPAPRRFGLFRKPPPPPHGRIGRRPWAHGARRRRGAAERVLRTGHRSPYRRDPLDLRFPFPRTAVGSAGSPAIARDQAATKKPTRSWPPTRSACWRRVRCRARSWSAAGCSIAAVSLWPVFSNRPASLGAAA